MLVVLSNAGPLITLVLIDDEIARSEARRLQLRVHGTLGILVQAYQQGLLSLLPQVKLLFQVR